MGVSYTIKDDIAEIKIEGKCAPDELFEGFQGLLADPGMNPKTHMFINVGESDTLPPPEVIERISFIIGTGKGKFSERVSVYVTQKVRYGLARQLSVYLESFGLVATPFYEYQAAFDWLQRNGQG